jgi:integrase
MRTSNKLSAVAVTRKTKPGRYADGGGLYLQVSKVKTKAWLFRFMQAGRAREMGLGAVDIVSLAEARDKARECRKLLLDGVDPIEHRRGVRMQAQAQAARGVTFKDCAERYVAAREAGWRNDKHRAQWKSTLSTYCYPTIGDLAVADIDVGLVLKCIEPIWTEKPDTAGRVRGRIEAVLDWAAARGYRTRDNPAQWKGHLDKVLPPRRQIARVQHHAALPYPEIPAFMADVRARDDVSARCLEFTILTAARTGEAVGAAWKEIDLSGKVWTVPAERMKGGREHRVPLSDRAIEILETLPREGEFVFPGGKAGKALSNMALLMTLRRMGRNDLTTHGFRSTFRDWCAESTNYSREVAEMSLAHAISSDVEAAYRRGDLFAKRRRLMAEWSKYCAKPVATADVLPLRKPAKSKKREAADHADV